MFSTFGDHKAIEYLKLISIESIPRVDNKEVT